MMAVPVNLGVAWSRRAPSQRGCGLIEFPTEVLDFAEPAPRQAVVGVATYPGAIDGLGHPEITGPPPQVLPGV